MLMRELGNSGIEVSAVGFGAWAIGGWMWGGSDDDQAVAALHAALDHGINLIDTAPAYGFGHSETIVGRAIHDRRDRVVLATKCGLIWDREEGTFFFHSDEHGASLRPATRKIYKNLRPASIRQEVEASLRRLQTDRIDLLQTHWQDPSTPLDETVATLEALKREGKIRAMGVSNCTVEHLRAYGPIASDQERYSIIDRGIETSGVLEFCRQADIGMLAYSPLSNGLLTGKIAPDRQYGQGDLRRANPRFQPDNVRKINAALAALQPMAERHGATVAQLIIAWTIARPGITCVLCGARNAQQAAENAAAGKLSLSAEELAEIESRVKT